MLPIQLRGSSLGERHKQLNTSVNQAHKNSETHLIYEDSEEKSDADRLFKIDLAVKCEDVNYILEMLKADDMLYASRALRATWLITDDKYAHIINPDHLYTTLYPQMYGKAVSKLKFNIRQHLRSEERCELFYKYHRNELNDAEASLAFLPYCSKDFILTTVNDLNILSDVTIVNKVNSRYYSKEKNELLAVENMFERIIGRFPDLAEPILKRVPQHVVDHFLSVIDFIAASQTDLYLHILEEYASKYSHFPKLSKSLSKKIARTKPQKIVDRLDVYLFRINVCSIANVWSKESIEQLLDILCKSKVEVVRDWLSSDSFTRWLPLEQSMLNRPDGLLSRMSKEDQKAIIQKYFPSPIEEIKENRDQFIYVEKYGDPYICPKNLHKWYKRIPFETSFLELKQLIRATQSPQDRTTLLMEMAELAGEDPERLHLVLTYYFSTHINEQKIYKIRFLDRLVERKHVYRFNEECWKYVNDLFISLETYGDENYKNYNEVIVFHDIINDKLVSDVIMEKYENNHHAKENIEKLSDKESTKILNYLVAYFENKYITVKDNIFTSLCYDLINNYISIINAWERCVLDYPTIINAITHLILYAPKEFYYSTAFYVYIVCYHIINESAIPGQIMGLYLKNGYSNSISHITEENKLKTFNYLVSDFQNRTRHVSVESVSDAIIDLTRSFIRFLQSSKKPLAEFPYLISLMKQIVTARPNSLSYPSEQAARRLLFDVSLLMKQSEDIIIDILKHDTSVLTRHFKAYEVLMIKQDIVYKKVLKKLLTYFDSDLAVYYKASFRSQLKNCEKKSDKVTYVTKNLSLIFKRQDFIEVIQEYFPKNHKVEWSEEDINVINIRKGLAANLHRVRPLVDMETVYEFAKGDYLQYTLPSLLSVGIAVPSQTFSEKVLPKLLNSPVSVQKHGIRLAFKKLKLQEVSLVLKQMWSKSKNVSIRNTTFVSTFTLLTKQIKEDKILILWQLIKTFISSLQEDEERTIILYLLANLTNLPQQVRSEGCQICYIEMERIKDKIDWDENRDTLLNLMSDWFEEGMNLEFVAKILLGNFDQFFATDYFHKAYNSQGFRNLFTKYILSGKEKENQYRYEKVARPIFSAIVMDWNKSYETGSVQTFFDMTLTSLTAACHKRLDDGNCYTLVFQNMLEQCKTVLSIEKKFDYYLKIKLLVIFNDLIQEMDFVKECNERYKDCALLFSKKCEQLLNELVDTYFPSIAIPFRIVLLQLINNIFAEASNLLKGVFMVSFIDNLVSAGTMPHINLLGLYVYNKIDLDVEHFEEESGGCFEALTSRLKAIDNKEIQFHMNAKLF